MYITDHTVEIISSIGFLLLISQTRTKRDYGAGSHFACVATFMYDCLPFVLQLTVNLLSRNWLMLFSPYPSMPFYFSNLFRNMALTPEEANMLKLGHGRGSFIHSRFKTSKYHVKTFDYSRKWVPAITRALQSANKQAHLGCLSQQYTCACT